MTTTTDTIAFTPAAGRDFSKGVKALKSWGGKFDGSVWHVRSDKAEQLMSPMNRERHYVVQVTTTKACIHYTRDNGCPLHGETCAPEYN